MTVDEMIFIDLYLKLDFDAVKALEAFHLIVEIQKSKLFQKRG